MRLFLVAALPIAFILYGHALEAPVYLDDSTVLEVSETPIRATRFLGFLSFYASSLLADGPIPLLFHWRPIFYHRLINLLVHVLAATALVGLARELTGRYRMALLSGFLFLIHPILSQPVMYLTQRFESLATLFMVCSAACYARFRRVGGPGGLGWVAMALVMGVAAALTKETAVMLPVWILLMELTFFRKWQWHNRLLYLLPLVPVVAYPAWLAFRSSRNTLTSIPLDGYLLSQGTVLLKYLQLSVFPTEQYLRYDVQVVEGLSWTLAGSWIVVAAILATGVVLIRRYPIAGFGILTFFVLLLPVTLLPLPDLIFEHRIYPAFVGLALAAGALIEGRFRTSVGIVLALVMLTYGVRTHQRAGEWMNEMAFLESHRARFPDDPLNLAALAVRYYSQGELILARNLLEHARENEDRFNEYYSEVGRINIALNLATIRMATRDLEAARLEIERARALNPDEPAVMQMEGTYYLAADEPDQAVVAFLRLTESSPTNPAGWDGLFEAYRRLGQDEEAEAARTRLNEVNGGVDAEDEAGLTRNPLISERARFAGVFAVVLALFSGTVGTLLWTWSDLRKRWSEWQNELSSS
jgi:hypothetical protein